MSDDAADLAVMLLKRHPRPDKVTWNEVLSLVKAICTPYDAKKSLHSAKVVVGGEEVQLSSGRMQIGSIEWRHSPRVSGIYREADLPLETGIEDRSLNLLNAALKESKYRGSPVLRVSSVERYGSRVIEVVLERPEGGGEYTETMRMEHQPDPEMKEEAKRIARQIDLRHRHRYRLMGEVHGARYWADAMTKDVDGVTHIGDPKVSYLSYESGDGLRYVGVTCIFRAMGHMLEMADHSATAHSDDNLRSIIANHRKNVRMKQNQPTGQMIEPILAAQIRAKASTYGHIFLEEIEAVLSGRGKAPQNPVKRGVSNISIRNGRVNAPVTLAKGVKFHNDRLRITALKGIPQAVLNTMPGRRVRDVIDHPCLDGQTIKSATLDKEALYLRMEPVFLELAPLLEELRSLPKSEK